MRAEAMRLEYAHLRMRGAASQRGRGKFDAIQERVS